MEVGTKPNFGGEEEEEEEEEEGSSLSEANKMGSSPSNLELQASTKTTQTLHSKQQEEEGT